MRVHIRQILPAHVTYISYNTVRVSLQVGLLSYCCLVTPVINNQIMDQEVNEKGTASFTCQATGQPVPTIGWYFNGALVDKFNTVKYKISTMPLSATYINNTLTIMNVESRDVGTYTCNATNVLSTDTSSGVLTVNGKLLVINCIS